MAGNTMTLEFAGDAAKLQAAARVATRATDDTADAARRAAADYATAGQEASRMEQRMGALGSATTGATDALDSMAGGAQGLADAMDYERASAAKLARANVDVMQATEDMAQATRDAKQASIDSEQAVLDETQARLDETTALEEYNKAVREHGKGSDEAAQAQIHLKQAGIDVKQALEDQEQAQRDVAQAQIDGKTAQVDLNDAMHEANPPDLQKFADVLNIVSPILTALVGIFSLVTAAQWLWNSALFASPITWIILGIVALIAVIVLLVKNWDKVKAAAGKAWDWIKEKAQGAWNWMKTLPGKIADAFGNIGRRISAPFKAGFNAISDAWNNTIGQLSWTVPGWVPGVGGNTISAPRLPKFHTGGVVPGIPGTEVPIMAMAGETVSPAGRSGGDEYATVSIRIDGDTLIEAIGKIVRRRGGNAQIVLGGANA
jgi:uncharacterized membrane protein YuzA (DUF378 family)